MKHELAVFCVFTALNEIFINTQIIGCDETAAKTADDANLYEFILWLQTFFVLNIMFRLCNKIIHFSWMACRINQKCKFLMFCTFEIKWNNSPAFNDSENYSQHRVDVSG